MVPHPCAQLGLTIPPTQSPTASPTIACRQADIEGYAFYPGKDFSGGDLQGRLDELRNNIAALKDLCDANTNCVAFNSDGWLKGAVTTAYSNWDDIEDLGVNWIGGAGCAEGIYVKHGVNVNV